MAVVTKSVILEGGYPADFSGHDPGLYHTVLDAQGGGSVISITNAGAVALQFLTLTHGDGTGNCGGNGCGGGIYAFNTFLHVGDCVITNNIASKSGSMGLGGGIYAKGDHNVYVWNNQIISNTANIDSLSTIYSYGGGIFIHSAPVLLKENLILNNVGSRAGTGGMGGGIFLYHVAQADVLTNTIQGNKASISSGTGTGGGLYILGNASNTVYVAANRIENNLTSPDHTGLGGGVYIADANVHLDRNTIISNATSLIGWLNPGGGVYIASSKPVTLSNNLIVDNQAGVYGGGVYVGRYISPVSQVLLVNNTIANNGDSGIVGRQYAVLTMTNNLIVSHMIGLTTSAPFTGTISADTNLFWNTSDPITGTNGIRQDPLLTPDHHPGSGSPALNTGLTIPWLTVDLAGVPRPQGSGYDIGAFEGGASGETGLSVYLPLILHYSP